MTLRRRQRIWLLTRRAGWWQKLRTFRTMADATRYVKSHYVGPWSWWGRESIAKKMLADKDYPA